MKTNTTTTRNCKKRFTLVELLVVVAILLILVAMLLPALEQARFSANVTDCAARMKEWSLSITLYAADHNRRFPNHKVNSSPGRNPWNIGSQFDDDMLQYGLILDLYSCPINPVPEDKFIRYYESSTGMIMFGYNYWVPRVTDQGDVITAGNVAPTGISSTDNQDRPVLTDMLAFNTGTLIANKSGAGVNLTSHWYNGYSDIRNVNHMYQDGHVKTVQAHDLEFRQNLDTVRDSWY